MAQTAPASAETARGGCERRRSAAKWTASRATIRVGVGLTAAAGLPSCRDRVEIESCSARFRRAGNATSRSVAMLRLVLTSLVLCTLVARLPAADPCGPCEVYGVQAYRLVYQTVYDQQQVTACRLECETVYDEQRVTCYRDVTETQMHERRYTVAKPIWETSSHEERYRVLRPVWETQIRDCSFDRVRTIVETAEREECYVVERPVWETQ